MTVSWTLVKKFLVALAGAASIAITQGLIEGTAAKWAALGISVATAAGVYIVPNTPTAETPPAPKVEGDYP